MGHLGPPRTRCGKVVESSTYLFVELATPWTGSRQGGLWASSGEAGRIPLGSSDVTLQLKRKTREWYNF